MNVILSLLNGAHLFVIKDRFGRKKMFVRTKRRVKFARVQIGSIESSYP
jgi:hypothetical protein